MKLLCAVDLGSRSEDVVKEAGMWAQRLGATVDLLYVDDTPDAAVFVGDPNVRAIVVEERTKLLAQHTKDVRALLDAVSDLVQVVTDRNMPTVITVHDDKLELHCFDRALASDGKQMGRVWFHGPGD